MSLLTSINKYRDVLLLLAVGVLVYLLVQKPKSSIVQVTNPLQLQQVQQMRDENGKLYAQISQQVLQLTQIQSFSDSLAKALKIKPKYIQGVDRVVTKDSVVYNNVPVEEAIITGEDNDSSIVYTVEKHDPWTDIMAKINPSKDTASIEYTSRDTLTRVQVAEAHLFSPTTYTVYMGNANPHNDIKEGASFQIKEKRTWLSVGPSIQYNPFTQKVDVGISVQIPLIQFKK